MSLHQFGLRSNNPNDGVQHPCVISAVDEDLLHKYQFHYDVDTKRIVAGFPNQHIPPATQTKLCLRREPKPTHTTRQMPFQCGL